METKTKTLFVHIPADLHRRAKTAAAKTDKTLARWVAEALEEKIAREEQPHGE